MNSSQVDGYQASAGLSSPKQDEEQGLLTGDDGTTGVAGTPQEAASSSKGSRNKRYDRGVTRDEHQLQRWRYAAGALGLMLLVSWVMIFAILAGVSRHARKGEGGPTGPSSAQALTPSSSSTAPQAAPQHVAPKKEAAAAPVTKKKGSSTGSKPHDDAAASSSSTVMAPLPEAVLQPPASSEEGTTQPADQTNEEEEEQQQQKKEDASQEEAAAAPADTKQQQQQEGEGDQTKTDSVPEPTVEKEEEKTPEEEPVALSFDLTLEQAGPDYFTRIQQQFADRTRAFPAVFSSIPQDSDRCAVMVEVRNHPSLEAALRNFAFYLAPKGWCLVVYHSEHNRGLLDRVTAGWSYVHKKLVHQESHADGLSRDDYQAYLASPAFWNEMPAENILIFQADAFLMDDSLEEWLQYDYVGAPWAEWLPGNMKMNIGNGGFSFRKKSAMLRCMEQRPYQTFGSGHSEDMYFSLDAGELLHKPSYQDGRRFSFETILPDSDVRPLGLHKPWDYLPGGVIEQTMSKYSTAQFEALEKQQQPEGAVAYKVQGEGEEQKHKAASHEQKKQQQPAEQQEEGGKRRLATSEGQGPPERWAERWVVRPLVPPPALTSAAHRFLLRGGGGPPDRKADRSSSKREESKGDNSKRKEEARRSSSSKKARRRARP